ncbi:amphi-Trp domain-containing protein [Pseudenhygromyxa sp. WMMC2535]|uniref:amphi-Trp domain-containing protein n=1 Tax=Pseudenhygromyxa sp. WMMC2535 TaxID=2712867 RepID=UPI001554144C|nr:amphi-Trp domain-containing protein [Pseudenhygromyxa sp. WMMC2535]NVB43385.1 amphi-Trp domain-containing protein [Pseudenhygromyxa sp. WMMC2535]
MSSDQTQTESPETETSETPAVSADALDLSAGDEGEGDEAGDEGEDKKSKKAKKDKPKKVKVDFEASMPRAEAVSYFEAIIGGLKSGRLEFRQEGDTLVLSPPDQLEIEVKASRKGDKGKVVFEIEWSESGGGLEILN